MKVELTTIHKRIGNGMEIQFLQTNMIKEVKQIHYLKDTTVIELKDNRKEEIPNEKIYNMRLYT